MKRIGARGKGSSPVVTPKYSQSVVLGAVEVRFPDGKSATVTPGRDRAYPHLRSQAPDTVPYYRFAATLLAGARRVLDFGCGSGLGTVALRGAMPEAEVTAFDTDPVAMQFAACAVPTARQVAATVPPSTFAAAFDGVVLVDVLGHSGFPLALLRTVRDCMELGGKVVVVEPRVHSSQVLTAPACCAAAPNQLARALKAAGLSPVAWFDATEAFVCCLAEAVQEPGVHELGAASDALGRGQIDEAVKCYERARHAECREVRSEALVGLAEVFVAHGDGDGATQCLLEAAQDATDARPPALLSRFLLGMGDYASALELARRAVHIDPLDPSAAYAVAQASEAMGCEDADARWSVAWRLAPADPSVASGYAVFCSERGQHDDAIRALERLRSYGGGIGVPFHLTLALVLDHAGRHEDARFEAKIAHKLAPDDETVLEMCKRLEAA